MNTFLFSIPSPLLHHPPSTLPICLMPRTLNPTSESKKIRLHSPFLHAQLPQMLPKVQYACWSKTLLSRSALQGSSESAKTDLPMLLASTSHTQTNPLPVSLMIPTKKTYRHPHQQFHVLIPPFKHHHRSAGLDTPSHSLTTSLQTKPSLPPSPEFVTPSTVVMRTLNRLKRLSGSAMPSGTEGHPANMTRRQLSLRILVRSDDWNLSQIPLHHRLPLTVPFRHLPYKATRKSPPMLRPPSLSPHYGQRTGSVPATNFLRSAGCRVSSSLYGSKSTDCFNTLLQQN